MIFTQEYDYGKPISKPLASEMVSGLILLSRVTKKLRFGVMRDVFALEC